MPEAFEVNRPTKLQRLIRSPGKAAHEPTHSHTKGLWMFAEPITIEKDGDIFDIFFIDSEGLSLPSQDRTTDTFASDVYADRQRRLLSIMISISTFVIFNGKLVDIERDLEALSVPEDLCALADRQTSLLWLMRDVDRASESVAADQLI